MAFLHANQEAANGICGRSPLVYKQIEEIVGKTCENITTTDLEGIRSLDLSGMDITTLHKNDFDSLTSLKSLNLRGNNLSSLPAGLFDKLTNLRGLNLKGNNLTCLPAIPGSVRSLELDWPRWTYPACRDTGDPAPSPPPLPVEDITDEATTDAADLADLKTMGKVVGIDLGTTNSCVAVVEGRRPVVVANAEGNRTTPSVVAYARNKDLLVGTMAKRQAVINPDNTFYSVKRFVGCTRAEVKDDLGKVAYGVKPDGNRLTIDCPEMGKALAPEEVSAQVLRKLAADASAFLGSKVTHAVVTVPAYFNDAQRQATRNAAWIAGLEVLRIVNEPTAAALAYGLGQRKDACILVFDLGGGTFDVSILQMEEDACEVLATSGDTHLGGDDFDKVIVDHLAETFNAEEGIDLRENSQTLQRLMQVAEEAKRELSNATRSNVNLPFITGDKVLDVTITREHFNDLSSHLLERCRVPVEQALADAGLSAADLDEVVLVGGSTRIPAVKDLVKTLTGKDPNQTVNPDEVVALGAAIQGNLLAGDADSGITLPAEDGEGEAPDDLAMLLLDVTPLSLGTEDGANGRMIRIIERNASIPAREQTIVTTVRDNQTSVVVKVFQGEQAMARDNKCLGDFKLDGIPPEPRGVPKIVVAMEIDANGILNVTARDQATGLAAFISISGSSTFSEAEVARMRKDAEAKVAD